MALEVGVDLELGIAHAALEWTVPGVRAQVHDQLARVAARIRTDLTPASKSK